MIAILRQLILHSKTYLGGLSSSSINGVVQMLPQGLIDTSFLTSTTSVMGVAVPTFFLYLIFFSE